jgi:mannitol-1-/sugar-/sorbitol-6-/2-deoxyglucose-6-phosphatase
MVDFDLIEAVIFDMDGLLIDSEPLWRRAIRDVLEEIGVVLSDSAVAQTMGLRIDEVVAYWYQRHPWPGLSQSRVAERMVTEVLRLIERDGEALPDVYESLAAVRAAGFKTGLASSSPRILIDAVLGKLGLVNHFQVLHSADEEPYGKPHPGIYMTTMSKLDVAADRALALEDSVNGVIAAKAARLACIAVPEPASLADPRFGVADLVLRSLGEFVPLALAQTEPEPPNLPFHASPDGIIELHGSSDLGATEPDRCRRPTGKER